VIFDRCSETVVKPPSQTCYYSVSSIQVGVIHCTSQRGVFNRRCCLGQVLSAVFMRVNDAYTWIRFFEVIRKLPAQNKTLWSLEKLKLKLNNLKLSNVQ